MVTLKHFVSFDIRDNSIWKEPHCADLPPPFLAFNPQVSFSKKDELSTKN